MARKSTAMRKEAALPKAEEQLRGYIEKVIFPAWGRESKNGFAILAVNLSGDSRMSREEGEKRFGGQAAFVGAEDYNRVTVKGTMPNPKDGDEIIFQGRWVEDPERGWQFLFSTFEIVLPTSEQGVVAYFSGDQFFGLGRVAAEKILKSLGPNCLNLLKENPDLAYQITDLSKKQQTELEQKMREHGALGDLIGLICQHGIGPGTAGRIFAHYGPESVKIVKENPYRLTKEVDGIGFKIADSIGSAVKIRRDSDFRIEAAIRHVLEEAKSEGHCALRSEFISTETLDLLGPGSGVDWGSVARAGLGMIKSGELCRVKNDAAKIDYIYLAEMHDAEESVAREVLSRIGPVEDVTMEMIEQLVDSLEGQMGEGFKLAPEQRQAVIWALLYKESVVTGGPGTGKSTISRLIRAGYASLYPYANIYQVAPTGRAAKRLSETTGESASTIHRQLRYNPEMGFEYNKNNQLPGPGLLLLDEGCFHWKTPVLLADGTWEHIGKIVNKKIPATVMSHNPDTGRLEPRQVKQWWKYERKSDLLEINVSRNDSTRRARKIRCTPQHMIATKNGYRRADSLGVGDRILVRGRFLTEFQRQVIMGTLLGDGHLNGLSKHRRESYQVRFCQGEKQLEYLRFKMGLFPGLFTGEPYKGASGYGGDDVWYATMNLIDEMDDWINLISRDGKIAPSSQILDMLGEVGLAIWYMDNGSICKNEHGSSFVTLHTERFDLDAQNIIVRWLSDKLGGNISIQKSRKYYCIRLNKEASSNFLDIIEPYIPCCMAYKHRSPENAMFNPVPERMIDIGEVPVRSIKVFNKKDGYDKHVYDIGIEGLHNYVAGNVVVHNSMVDIELARSLMEAIPENVQVVFIGDVDQLPSVGPGTVLRDIIYSGVVPTTRLKYVYRQEEGSTISLLADMINRYDETKDMPDLRGMQNVCGGRDFKFFEAETADEAHSTIQGIMRDWHDHGGLKIMDFQVLTPLKDKGAACAKHLNSMLRDIFNPAGASGQEESSRGSSKPEKVYGDKLFRDGDKIMKVKRNDYKKMLFNGDIGTMGFEYGKPMFLAEDNFIPLNNDDLSNIELAYAFTIHKSQGSESPLVVVVCIRAHYIMLQRNLIYTAITRAKKRLAIVGSQDAFKIAVRNNKIEHRYGLLQQRLRGEI